jgi:hypothetical protein
MHHTVCALTPCTALNLLPQLQTATLQHYTQYTVDDLWACVRDIGTAHRIARTNSLHAIFDKYSRPEHGTVATRFPTLSEDTLAMHRRSLDRLSLPPLVIAPLPASVPAVLNPMSASSTQ